MSKSKITLGSEQTMADRHGRTFAFRAVKINGKVAGLLSAEPTGRPGEYELVGQGLAVSTPRNGASRLLDATTYTSFSSRGSMPVRGLDASTSLAEYVVTQAMYQRAEQDGYGWACYAAKGSSLPDNPPPGFEDGARRALENLSRTLRGGVLTGDPRQ